MDWGKLAAPDERETIDALAASPDGVAYAIDTASTAYMTTINDGWSAGGVVEPGTTFHDLDAWENERVYVAADNGCIYRYENEQDEWAPLGVVKDFPLASMALHDDGDDNAQMAVIGDDTYLYERTGPEDWERTELPTEAALYDLSLGAPDLVVGKSGTVLERERTETATQLGDDRETLKARKKQRAADDVDADDPPHEPDGDGSEESADGDADADTAESGGSNDGSDSDADEPDPPDEPDS